MDPQVQTFVAVWLKTLIVFGFLATAFVVLVTRFGRLVQKPHALTTLGIGTIFSSAIGLLIQLVVFSTSTSVLSRLVYFFCLGLAYSGMITLLFLLYQYVWLMLDHISSTQNQNPWSSPTYRMLICIIIPGLFIGLGILGSLGGLEENGLGKAMLMVVFESLGYVLHVYWVRRIQRHPIFD